MVYVFRWFCYYQELLICQTLELQKQENFQGVSTLLTERKERTKKSTQNMISSKQIKRTCFLWRKKKSSGGKGSQWYQTTAELLAGHLWHGLFSQSHCFLQLHISPTNINIRLHSSKPPRARQKCFTHCRVLIASTSHSNRFTRAHFCSNCKIPDICQGNYHFCLL